MKVIYAFLLVLVLVMWIYSREEEAYTATDIETQKRRMEYIKRLADDILRDMQSPVGPATVSETWYYGRSMEDVLKALKQVYPTKNIFPVEESVFKTARFNLTNAIMVIWKWSSAQKTSRVVVQVVGMPPPMRISIPNVIGLPSQDAVNQLKLANPGALVRRVLSTDSYSVDFVPNRITVVHDASNMVLRVLQN